MQRPPEVAYIALQFADDTVGIMQFVRVEYAPDGTIRRQAVADAPAIEREIARASFDASKRPIQGWQPIAPETIPASREYRDAWIWLGGAIRHDLPKAGAIALARVRAARTQAFADLDAQWMRATGRQDTTTADVVEAQRQVLRDQPQQLAAALAAVTTIDELTAAVAANRASPGPAMSSRSRS